VITRHHKIFREPTDLVDHRYPSRPNVGFSFFIVAGIEECPRVIEARVAPFVPSGLGILIVLTAHYSEEMVEVVVLVAVLILQFDVQVYVIRVYHELRRKFSDLEDSVSLSLAPKSPQIQSIAPIRSRPTPRHGIMLSFDGSHDRVRTIQSRDGSVLNFFPVGLKAVQMPAMVNLYKPHGLMEEYLFLYDLGAVHASSLGNWHHGMILIKLETENATTRMINATIRSPLHVATIRSRSEIIY